MAKPRIEQLHHSNLQLWNFKGKITEATWNPTGILSSDAWLVTVNKAINDVNLRIGDLVIALADNPDPLSSTTIASGAWKVVRHLTDAELEWLANQLYVAPTLSLSGVSASYLKYGYDSSPAVTVRYTVEERTEPITRIKLERIVTGGGTTTIFDDDTNPSLTGNVATTVELNATTAFKLTVYTATRSFDTTVTASWYYQCFQGVYAGESLDEAALEGLTSYNVSGTANIGKTGTFNCANSSDHWFYAIPEDIHPIAPDYIEFKIQDMVTLLTVVADVTRTIGSGTTPVNHKVYRTPNPGVGARSYVITYKNV